MYFNSNSSAADLTLGFGFKRGRESQRPSPTTVWKGSFLYPALLMDLHLQTSGILYGSTVVYPTAASLFDHNDGLLVQVWLNFHRWNIV